MRNRALVTFLAFCAAPIAAVAEGVPGADDPALQSAAYAWLLSEDSAAEISALGEIAADGNIAARIFTNFVYRQFGNLDFPGLDRDQRRALLPEDRHEKPSRFSPYHVDRSQLPSTIAREYMENAASSEEWIIGAQILVDEGLIEHLKSHLYVLGNRPDLDIEAFLFAEDFIDGDDYYTVALSFRGMSQSVLEYLDQVDQAGAEELRNRWQQEPWSSQHYDELSRALIDGKWSAIRTYALLSQFGAEIDVLFADVPNDEILTWGQLAFSVAWNEPWDNEVDLEALGNLIANDAERTPSLQPLLNSCEAHCPNDLSTCLAAGVLTRTHELSPSLFSLEPMISPRDYHTSERAARYLTYYVGTRERSLDPDRAQLKMPQCYLDEAQKLVDLIDPIEQ
ncbi:MAG: hypothetical protein ABJM43_00535 [Paracoccaceae bacterium]